MESHGSHRLVSTDNMALKSSETFTLCPLVFFLFRLFRRKAAANSAALFGFDEDFSYFLST